MKYVMAMALLAGCAQTPPVAVKDTFTQCADFCDSTTSGSACIGLRRLLVRSDYIPQCSVVPAEKPVKGKK
jgi:hypothetical protein